MADNYSEMDVVIQNDSWQLCWLNDYWIHTEVIRKIERCISILFCLVFVFIFIRFFACLSVFFFFNEISLSSRYEAFRCTIFCHFFLMWKVQFLNIKKIYICLVFFNYISYMAISKGQIIKSRQWSEIMSRVRNEEKPQRCWFNWSNV